jgi:hypothetical protein
MSQYAIQTLSGFQPTRISVGFTARILRGFRYGYAAKPAAATSNSAAARKLSATIFAYYLQAMVPI